MQKGHRMGQIQDLEQRIAAAFARISAGMEDMSARIAAASQPDAQAADAPGLTAALHEERAMSAALHARMAAFSAAAEENEQALQGEVDMLTRHLDAQGLDVQRLSGTVAQLREDLRRLREAAVQGVVDPGLINKAMMAELEALRATRHAEATEMNDILAALGPIIDAEEARAHA